jgi:hypothetical protein
MFMSYIVYVIYCTCYIYDQFVSKIVNPWVGNGLSINCALPMIKHCKIGGETPFVYITMQFELLTFFIGLLKGLVFKPSTKIFYRSTTNIRNRIFGPLGSASFSKPDLIVYGWNA